VSFTCPDVSPCLAANGGFFGGVTVRGVIPALVMIWAAFAGLASAAC
jgi:hypothetical protein